MAQSPQGKGSDIGSNCPVMIRDDPDVVERTAAEELQRFLGQRASGAQTHGGVRIILGREGVVLKMSWIGWGSCVQESKQKRSDL